MAKLGNYLNTMSLEFASLLENVGLARIAVATFASQAELTIDDLEEVKVAVSEAVTNAIIHGYQQARDRTVSVKAQIDTENLVVIVEDTGIGISDLEKAMEPAYSTDPERMGLGFVFMKTFMNDLKVETQPGQGTKVIMTRWLPVRAGEALPQS